MTQDILNKQIKKIRQQRHLTQDELAEASGISVNYISRMERIPGQNISVGTLQAIADSLSVDITTFFKPFNSKNSAIEALNRKLNDLPDDLAEQYAIEFFKLLNLTSKTTQD